MDEEVKLARQALYDQLDASLPNGWAFQDLLNAIDRLIEARITSALKGLQK